MRKKAEGKALGFGRRGRAKVALAERTLTSMQRLKQIGTRWWGKKEPQKKKDPRGMGFKRSRLDI